MSVCFSWAHRLCNIAADARARRQARSALEDVRRGYAKLIDLDFPEGGAKIAAGISLGVAELNAVVASAQAHRDRPWLQPLADEQAQFLQAYPGCGTLLRAQICKGMDKQVIEDMCVGKLAISDLGLAFNSIDIPGEMEYSSGFVSWEQVTAVEKGPSDRELTVTWNTGTGDKFLRLRLSAPSDFEWMEAFWRIRSSHSTRAPGSACQPKYVESGGFRGSRRSSANGCVPDDGMRVGSKRQATEDSEPTSECDEFDTDLLETFMKHRGQSFTEPLRSRMLSTASNFGSPWIDAAPDGVPPLTVPEHTDPLCVHQLPHATLASLSNVLEADEWPFPTFMSQFHGASTFLPCKWARSSRVPDTTVRVLTFTMPLPQELPRAVAMLINLPEHTRITNTYRLKKAEDEIILICQVNSPEVPFGENFRIQELNSFRSLPGGGVECRKWVEVIWVVALPWGCGPIKQFAEKKILEDYCKGAGPLAEFLNAAATVKAGRPQAKQEPPEITASL